MASTPADRSVMFGTLALQMAFITKDALHSAMSAWVLAPDMPLGQILTERGHLTSEQCGLLDKLVEQQLATRGNEAARILAELAPATPGPWNADAPGELADRLAEASAPTAAGPAEDDPYATRGTIAGVATTLASMRFHVLRPLARGGLGEVFVAEDQELHREVALKQLLNRHADNLSSRARFLLEAEITGGLEHPGVVPVYGLGQYSDGRPYYAMRFIRGDNLQKAIEHVHAQGERSLDFNGLEMRQLLGRFIAVCQVIAYAHSRGVIHRDIKPANIMLGQYGETLVVDWGLAKLLLQQDVGEVSEERPLTPSTASGSGETLPGSAMGTPQYMSPEQAAGRVNRMGVTSDVYCLGATLYPMLTGRAPFASKAAGLGELLQDVQRGNFPPPRQLNPSIPPALEAICLKAMAHQPGDRYASAASLANDMEHWLADEPVAAYPEPWLGRLQRWARHHRAWTLTAAGVLIAVVLTTSLAAVLLAGLADRERQARLTADRMRTSGIQVAARFAARTVATEIDLRWRILETKAADGKLHDLLTILGASERPLELPQIKQLQEWVEARHSETAAVTRALGWNVLDQRGRVLARSPYDQKVVGRSFAFRDYFHGQGRDLPDGTLVNPITDVHRSVTFRSRATGRLNVAFTVPIRDDRKTGERAQIGVLMMAVELGQFGVLQLGLSKDQLAVLADSGSDWIEGEEANGLILHHPGSMQLLAKQASPPQTPIHRLPAALVTKLEDLRAQDVLRLRDPNKAVKEPSVSARVAADYRDPVGGEYAGGWLAAFEPIIIKGRADRIADTGWVVIVQERADHQRAAD